MANLALKSVRIYAATFLAVMIWSRGARAETSPSAADASSAAQCKAVADADFSNIPDAPTQISLAGLVDNPDQLLSGLHVFAAVFGAVTADGGDGPADPQDAIAAAQNSLLTLLLPHFSTDIVGEDIDLK